eukprot:6207954-Lingulodinium_polyedra.AAC.1
MSQLSLGTQHLDLFERLCRDPGFRTEKSIAEKRQRALQCPRPTSQEKLRELGAFEVEQQPAKEMPGWAGQIAQQREHFHDCVLVIKGVFTEQFFKVVYVVKSPIYLALSPVESYE